MSTNRQTAFQEGREAQPRGKATLFLRACWVPSHSLPIVSSEALTAQRGAWVPVPPALESVGSAGGEFPDPPPLYPLFWARLH